MRARNLKPNFFKSEKLADQPFQGRLLFAGLWLLSDCFGNQEYRPRKIKAELFPYDFEINIEELMINLDKSGLVRIYSVNDKLYLNIPKFLKHQNPHKNEKEKGSDIPECSEEAHQQWRSGIIENNPDKNGTAPADSLFPLPSSLIPDSPILTPDSEESGDDKSSPDNFKKQSEIIFDSYFENCQRLCTGTKSQKSYHKSTAAKKNIATLLEKGYTVEQLQRAQINYFSKEEKQKIKDYVYACSNFYGVKLANDRNFIPFEIWMDEDYQPEKSFNQPTNQPKTFAQQRTENSKNAIQAFLDNEDDGLVPF